MTESTYSLLERGAGFSQKFLVLFVVFFAGFTAAHLDSVQRLEKSIATGELFKSLRSTGNGSFDDQITVWKGSPHGLQHGALLIGAKFSQGPALAIVDEDGKVLHQWTAENRIFNPELTEWWGPLSTKKGFSVDGAVLLPQGDVIFNQVQMDVNNFRGQRLVRMDRDSHVVWQVPGNFHHRLHLGGNPQRIYAISSQLKEEIPQIAPRQDNVRYLEDWVEVYTLDGKKEAAWSLVDAFTRSPAYRNWLSSFEIDIPELQKTTTPDGKVLYDLFHLNSVQYLDAAQAKAIPDAREGDLLLSFRGLNGLAVFRPATEKIVWAQGGPWRHQHNAQVGEDGNLYVFDNEGGRSMERVQSRLIRYEPTSGRLDVIHASPQMHSFYLGDYEQMSNGWWMMLSPQEARVVVITPQKKIVWEMRTVPDLVSDDVPYAKQIGMADYLKPSEIAFLSAPQKDAPMPSTGNANRH